MQKLSRSHLTLITMLCLSFGAVAPVSQVQAKDKSEVSPDIVVPSVEESAPATTTPSAPQVSEPAPAVDAIAPPEPQAPAQVEVQTTQEVKSSPVRSEPITVEVQSRTSKPDVAISTPKSSPERVDIIMESRNSGCRSVVSSTRNLQPDLCAPQIDRRDYQAIATHPSFVYESSSGFRTEVRQLTPREIKAMSRPSNGDKRMQFPLAIPAFISSSFGFRIHPITGQGRFHQGTDIAAAEGTPVLAAYSGRVEVAGWLGGYGYVVAIGHSDTHETRYAHLSEVLVKPGQYVKQGTVIGLVGSTGFSTGPHLHFELWERRKDDWVVVDPTDQLVLALDELNRYLAQLVKSTAKG
ncbi:M23 family metallopeptidase [Pseudanabaena sp. PCC 6802]|uniref:M23 family metallopeptidase n=1 Tax=Pseudanabaena sp. PCC 6802 TaxID=118173 RepID=UPI00034D99F4|nr:M23 family metallopeptidase [Pseudanabaena sp. PCC 6802]